MTRERAERLAWLIGCLGLPLALLGWLLKPEAFAYAWLAALSAWIGWPLGCLALLLTHALTGGRWGNAIRPYLLIGIRTLPLLLPAIVPLLFVLPKLYPWLRLGHIRQCLLSQRILRHMPRHCLPGCLVRFGGVCSARGDTGPHSGTACGDRTNPSGVHRDIRHDRRNYVAGSPLCFQQLRDDCGCREWPAGTFGLRLGCSA